MKKYWTRQRILLLVAVVCFAVFGLAGFGLLFDPLVHAFGWLGAGLVAFVGSFWP